MILADMGADVLKIETPPALSPESGSGMSAHTERQAAFSYMNRNKRSLGLNLKTLEGQTILHQLAAGADVLVEGFRPGRPISRPSSPRPQLPCHQWCVKPHW